LKLKEVITLLPRTGLDTLKRSFGEDSVGPWLLISSTTLLTYAYDREIFDEVKRWGRSSGIGNDDKTKAVIQVNDLPLLRLPSDTSSAIYFFGDGWTHFAVAGGFMLSGLREDHNRAWNTGIEIVHGMVASTFFSQAIKRSTGRESPSDATTFRGRWQPFPNPKDYGKNTAKYDAFPSGHIMTATLSFSVITINYPEYAAYTIPAGALWITALGLQMINNGVHWASDYPLGIGIGYVVARSVTQLDNDSNDTNAKSARNVFVLPGEFDGTPTMNIVKFF
jgi:hypothetical protein